MFKMVIMLCILIGTILLYGLYVQSRNGRYQMSSFDSSIRILDTKAGKIYFYNARDGYYYFEGWRVRHSLKQLPQ
jgi:hypothetical protein